MSRIASTHSAVLIDRLDRGTLLSQMTNFISIASDVPGEYWAAEHFLHELPRKFELSCYAHAGAAPVGYAIVSEMTPGAAHLHHFMITRDYRGSGLGRHLLNATIERLVAARIDRLTLKVANGNTGARRFYSTNGFSEVAEGSGYVVAARSLAGT